MKRAVSLLLVIIFFLTLPGAFSAASSPAPTDPAGEAEEAVSLEIVKKTPVLVIDPGHGGWDSGAIRSGVKEKNLNLDIAKRLQKLMKKHEVQVYMTRTTDKYVGLYDRSAFANEKNADLFVSIHNNADRRWMKGSMTLYYPGAVRTDRGLSGRNVASIVQRELTGRLGTVNRGLVSRPNLAVLRTTKMPAIIAEVAYMSNKSDMAKLKTASFRQKSAEALEKAILKILKIK